MQQLLRKLFFIRLTSELAARLALIFLLYKKLLGLYSLLFLPLVFLWLPSIKKIALEFDRKFKAKERFASTLLELPAEKREVIEAQASPLIKSRFDLRSFLNLLVVAFCLIIVFRKDPFIQKIDALLDDPSVDKKEELIAIKEALISDGLGSEKLDIVLRQIEEEEPQEDKKEEEKKEDNKSEDKKEGEQKEQEDGKKDDSKSEEEGKGDTETKGGKGGKSEESSKEGSGEQKSDKGSESNQSDERDKGEGSKLIEEIKKEHQEKKGEQQSNKEQKGEKSEQKADGKDKENKDSKGEGQSQGQPEKKPGEEGKESEKKPGEKGKEDKKEKKGDPKEEKGEKEGDKGEEREGESQNKQSGGESGEGPKEGESEEGDLGDLKFEEVSIPGQDEKLDESQVTDETKASDNKDEAKYKREMEEMLNLKSDPALERKRQYIPKEYEEYFR